MSEHKPLPATISLIGMPGAGKSTIGVILAKLTGRNFLDTDIDIQVFAGATLEDILQQQGYLKLRAMEQQVLLQVPLENSIIATGGSVVYSESVMLRLREAGPVIYLYADFDTLAQRVADAPLRGIAAARDQSFLEIFRERTPLYQQYSDFTLSTTEGSPEQVAAKIVSQLASAEHPLAAD